MLILVLVWLFETLEFLAAASVSTLHAQTASLPSNRERRRLGELLDSCKCDGDFGPASSDEEERLCCVLPASAVFQKLDMSPVYIEGILDSMSRPRQLLL
jgi:hypothetical protein